MWDDLNIFIVSGRVATDIKSTRLVSGQTAISFKLASSRYRGKTWGAETYFYNCVAVGKIADNIEKWLSIGQKVDIRGIVAVKDYVKDGIRRKYINVIVREIKFGPKPKGRNKAIEPEADASEDIPPTPTEEDFYYSGDDFDDMPF